MSELAADGVPVAVSLRVLKLSRAPYYRWRKQQVTNAELVEVYRANALFDAHRDDDGFGYRLLADEAAEAGEPMCRRTAWRIWRDNQWYSAFGQLAQTDLPAAAVIGPLDPGNNRDPELISGPPALAVQDVLLQQREEGLHRGVVACGTDLAHRSDEVMTVQGVHELS